MTFRVLRDLFFASDFVCWQSWVNMECEIQNFRI